MLKLLTSAGLLVLLQGCFQHEETVALWQQVYTLKPQTESIPVDLTNAKIVGYCSVEERMNIAHCLGRIPVTNLPVSQITIVWPNQRLAAEVTVSNGIDRPNLIYLTKNRDQIWEIRGTAKIVN